MPSLGGVASMECPGPDTNTLGEMNHCAVGYPHGYPRHGPGFDAQMAAPINRAACAAPASIRAVGKKTPPRGRGPVEVAQGINSNCADARNRDPLDRPREARAWQARARGRPH